tara:strand:+ start:574 stop:771 length:198 start_codon:yes stop_codon:yes gene_type:complete
MLPPKVKLEANEKKELNTIIINQPDMLEDITNIRDMLEQQTGMFISGPNVIRACIKAWYDLNNNG